MRLAKFSPTICWYYKVVLRAGSGLFFPTQFGSAKIGGFFRVSLGSKLFLFGPSVSGPIFKWGFDFSEFNLIFLGLIIQEIVFLVGFFHVCPRFPTFLLNLGCSGQKYITSGYLQFSQK